MLFFRSKLTYTFAVSFSHYSNTADTWNGGAIAAYDDTEIQILDCTFHGNDALLGGAVYTSGMTSIQQSTFYYNHAAAAGGALFCAQEGEVTVVQTTMYENRASQGGAIYVSDFSSLNLPSSTLRENRATDGGGIFNGGILNSFNTMYFDNFAEDAVSQITR